MTQVFRPLVVLSLLLVAAGCGREKSASPLSPSLAGPISGVEIGAPTPVLPASGASFNHDTTQVLLTIENASTSGPRPLSYTFEIAADAAMTPVVFTFRGVAPGAEGRTSVPVAGPFAPGRTYYWRAHAGDGANTGPYSTTVSFRVFELVTYQAPRPVAPVGGVTVASTSPILRTTNAARTGPPEATRYEFEIALSNTFGALVAGASVDEQAGETALTVGPLATDTLHVWRVRARSASAIGPWSATETFRTPTLVATPPPAPPGQLPPSNPGPRPNRAEGAAMVSAVMDDLRRRGISTDGDCGAFEITRRVAWRFANRGAGLERKPGGRNCQGHSIDIILFTDGMSVDMLIGAGVDNGPVWQEHGVLPDWRDWWIAPTNPD